ncbi:MAG: pyridoxal phosphate-dependent aminotransferase [Anaerolineales bacterium]|nr:pyridoxal phosphate-dependent aminotransferase [Anaerolineales bacterium]
MAQSDPLAYFRLKQIRAARVSEISEATAAAPVPPEERVNFHIGNPLQDVQLSSAFLRIALGIDVHRQDLPDANPDAILEYLGWGSEDKPKLEFLIRAIQKSSPYMPRGGYNRKAPHPLVKSFGKWLENQSDALKYDMGEQSGRREVILASGGIGETLRVILHAISEYLQITPARILIYRHNFPELFTTIPNLIIDRLSDDERLARVEVDEYLKQQPETPTFLLIGGPLTEETRRMLRLLSLERPLFFIEANNAPNRASLAREAKLVHRVIRLLTPAIFASRLHTLSTVFIAGNADFLSVIENVHFKLKGTPSASEIEFLSFLLEQNLAKLPTDSSADIFEDKTWLDEWERGNAAEVTLSKVASRVGAQLDQMVQDSSQSLTRAIAFMDEKTTRASQMIQDRWKAGHIDELADMDSHELLNELILNAHDLEWQGTLQRSFLSQFVKHQNQYRPDACLVASGSSRTALGLLGFHCGITDVVIPDLSWSYEQCFPNVHTVPLTEDLALDVNALIAKIEQLCHLDPQWHERGALAINNPHNATGRIFSEEDVRKLIAYCLEHNIYVIDDLAYQNVAPVDGLPEIKTARQVATDLVRDGILNEADTERVISVHSMSKTDCLAGARLSVVEIREEGLRERFRLLNELIQPNLSAIFICYLFYRGPVESARTYWRLRNKLFKERTQALMTALENLPADRNPFGITIIPPTGSMYPLLHVGRLPDGLSLDWLASSLARRGIGLLPLATFARTEEGFDTGRRTFRLTLGGVDNAATMEVKTRRLLIDLNRLIAEEDARYNRKQLKVRNPSRSGSSVAERLSRWDEISSQLLKQFERNPSFQQLTDLPVVDGNRLRKEFISEYLPERLDVFRTRLADRAMISDELMRRALTEPGTWLVDRLESEFMKDSLARRQRLFHLRNYDRTVHPTQKYSMKAEMAFDLILRALIAKHPVSPALIETAGQEALHEYLGNNVSIDSQLEADEILLDFGSLVASEAYSSLFTDTALKPFLSFWSDWDGSNRPSGQGHRLIAAAVMANVRRMARILDLLREADTHLDIDPNLLIELDRLPQRSQRFTNLLNNITQLTHQLEQRYRGILPFSVDATPLQRLATSLHLRRDPAKTLWQHNDRYEQKMQELRRQRREMLETYFALNKQLRKQLHALLPAIHANRNVEPLLRETVGYSDILQRIVVTPRIHQGMITARDQFAIETTAYNMQEINAIAGKYGNPGMTLALQISMSSKSDALIALDRKMGMQAEHIRRDYADADLPSIWLIPLFEDFDAVTSIPTYLDRIWDYATQSRHTDQTPQKRFTEIMAEVFIAGSDLSQQISQANGAFQYLKAKYGVQAWLAEHGVAESIRIKMGSGEPMQRQGGYYSHVAGQAAFVNTESQKRRLSRNLPGAAQKSADYAVTPLQGVFLGGDLRTFQSNISEEMRFLPVQDLVNLLYHVREAQKTHRENLLRAAETLAESRMSAQSRSVQELERLTIGMPEPLYEGFLQELTEHFRHILYGRPEDVIGIHVISYFFGRSMPQLRDRPTSRPRSASGVDRGQQILANIAEIIPFSKQGSLLRAIAHNQAQTAVLGINQLTTGLFRALEYYAQKALPEAERDSLIAERILPRLPVYEILHTLRIYQDWQSEFLKRIEPAFPAGNSAFVALREDSDAMHRFLPLFQQELLRRHGLNVSDFVSNGVFIPDLLPTLRPDLAVLMQRNLFNTDIDLLLEKPNGKLDDAWLKQTTQLLQLPKQIRYWRSIIWDLMGDSIYQRVQSFTELATALHSFSSTRSFKTSGTTVRGPKLSSTLTGFIRTARSDDEMRQFLTGAVEYLSSFTEGSIEIPVSIIRAMNDVERLAMIEESALSAEKQAVLRCCTLQIARLAGENG